MIDAAVVLQHIEERETGGEILANHFGAIDLKRYGGLPQHQQTGGVIDLAVDQNDRFDSCIADTLSRMGLRKVLKLIANVWRRIEEDPVSAIGTHSDR